MNIEPYKSIVVIVAHPDDETLWAGGTILNFPHKRWFVVCLCKASDKERSARFFNAMKILNAHGIMGDLDDRPDQHPLDAKVIEKEILQLLPMTSFDLILTHNSTGEYTTHLRHEEVNKAVLTLLQKRSIIAKELWIFAYEDGNKTYFPKIIENANIIERLSDKIWNVKYKLMTETYGFDKDSWEAKTTPKTEAFWQFRNPREAFHSVNHFANNIDMSKLEIFKLLANTKN